MEVKLILNQKRERPRMREVIGKITYTDTIIIKPKIFLSLYLTKT
jgi:hypothetical protein